MLLAVLTLTFSLSAAPPQHGCRVVPAEEVVRVQGARVIVTTSDIIPESDVKRSGDSDYWGCWTNGVLTDLYAPPDDGDYDGEGPMSGQ